MTNIRYKLRELSKRYWIQKLSSFFDGWAYPAVYALFIFLSSLFGWELPVYFVTTGIVVFTALFSADSKPLIAPVILVVYSTSWVHSPQNGSQFFNTPQTIIIMAVLGCIIAFALLFRLFSEGEWKKFFCSETMLKYGLLALAGALIINGVFFAEYKLSDLFLGILIAASFIAFYVYFYCTLDRKNNIGKYFAYILLLASAVIFLQIVELIAFGDVFTSEGAINKDKMKLGWGMSNNVGGMLAMFIPASLYFAYKSKHGWLFYITAFIQLGAVCLTLSRTSVLVGGIILFAAAIVLSIVKSRNRKFFRIFNLIILLVGFAFSAIFFDKIKEIFAVFFERGFSDSGRFEIWMHGLKNFLKAPFFGTGFYDPVEYPGYIENWVFPNMYHNIVIQLMSSCGIVGILAYVYHLAQVANLTFRSRATAERLFYLGIFLMVSGMSLLDNHIFHLFPALVYSLTLTFWEMDATTDAQHKFGKKDRLLAEETRLFKSRKNKY